LVASDDDGRASRVRAPPEPYGPVVDGDDHVCDSFEACSVLARRGSGDEGAVASYVVVSVFREDPCDFASLSGSDGVNLVLLPAADIGSTHGGEVFLDHPAGGVDVTALTVQLADRENGLVHRSWTPTPLLAVQVNLDDIGV
jgi:hypothetical protein